MTYDTQYVNLTDPIAPPPVPKLSRVCMYKSGGFVALYMLVASSSN